MKIALGSDHAGFELKECVRALLLQLGHEVIDLGTHDTSPVDYPDFAEAVGRTVLGRKAERGIVICGSGVGASVAANKIPGIRAGLCHDTYSAHQGVEHDHMNVLVLGGGVVGPAMARELVQAFVEAQRGQEERHLRRLAKVQAMEERYTGKDRIKTPLKRKEAKRPAKGDERGTINHERKRKEKPYATGDDWSGKDGGKHGAPVDARRT
jgi:RpiB/LacA/LacB family sugar-phosphate isomerase